MSGILNSSDPLVFSLLTKFDYLDVVVLETGTEFAMTFPADWILKYSCTKTDHVQHCNWVETCCYITERLRNALKPDDSQRKSLITDRWRYTPVWKQCERAHTAT
jgi:hypothetical protein